MDQFRGVENYYKEIKIHQLNMRYGRPATEPKKPKILEPMDPASPNYRTVAGMLLDKCSSITVWPIYDSGFGWHFVAISGEKNYMNQMLRPLSVEYECDLLEVKLLEIPCW